jgi:plasmid stability protein
MSGISVRKIPEETLEAVRRRAARHGKSMEQEIRDILDEAVRWEESVQRADEISERIRARVGVLSDSTGLIREDRDSR